MRTFIAIEIPEEIKQRLSEAQSLLKNSGAEAIWTRPEGIHLTLKFLGEVSNTIVAGITAALAPAMEESRGFRLTFSGAGVFPHTRNPRVAWIGVGGELDKLRELQNLVEEQTVRLGCKREDRIFQPHLTLGRIKAIPLREPWSKALEEINGLTFPFFDVTAISIMKSELKPAGAVYTEMGSMKLKEQYRNAR